MATTRVLITGMTGMAGSHLVDYLLAHTDWDLYGMCRWRSPLDNIRHLMRRINAGDRVFLVNGELKDTVSLQDVIDTARPDYVFHLAAQSYPRTSFASPLDTLDTNILGTTRLLDVIRRTGFDPVIHVCSSSEVFGRVGQDKLPINEECTFHPASPYAISKVGADLIGRYYAEAYGMQVIVTRMFTHTGPRRGDVFAESTFAKQIAMIEQEQMPPVVKTGNLDSLRTWADVRDAVRAYYMLVTVHPIAGEYYNISGSHTCTVGETLEYLLSLATRTDITVETDPQRLRPVDVDLQIPNTTKFQRHTGWKPEIPFEQTMQDLLDYWRQRIAAGEVFPTH
ncbi:GDP-6-deoxy-D-mannose reductase [Candidatus Entotheonellaceae bacterium PAL068K]